MPNIKDLLTIDPYNKEAYDKDIYNVDNSEVLKVEAYFEALLNGPPSDFLSSQADLYKFKEFLRNEEKKQIMEIWQQLWNLLANSFILFGILCLPMAVIYNDTKNLAGKRLRERTTKSSDFIYF